MQNNVLLTSPYPSFSTYCFFRTLFASSDLSTLTVCLGGVITTVDNQILGAVVVLAREVAGKDSLGTVGVTLLRIEGCTGHVRNHGITATEGVLGSAQDVVARGGLGEPDITTVTGEVARLESLSDILLDDDGATSGVDEIRTLLHLGDELLVEETLGLLMERAVDGDNVTLGKHLLEILDTTAANLLLLLRAEGLVIKVQKLLAVEGLQPAEDTLTDTANGDGTNDLVLEIVLLLGDGGNVPLAALDLLVSGDEVTDESEDGHDDVLSDGDDVGSGNLGDGDTAVGLVGGIEVDVVGTNTGGDGDLEVLGLGEALGGEVAGVEGSGDDDLSIYELLVELGVLTILVGGGNEGVTLILEPLADAELVLSGAEQLRNLIKGERISI